MTSTPTIVIGSRGSQLALWQARWIEARLKELGAETRIEIIKTTGDQITDVPLAKVGGKGLFTKEIEDALLERRIDCAVHSLKDLPTELPAGLTIAAVPERQDPRDALLGRKLDELSQGAKVGTSSLRRSAQLLARRPDLVIESLRGNLDTRIRKLDEGQYEAILLAAAGLNRLGWADRIAELLEPGIMCPAVGQGALAVETRDDGGAAFELCRRLNHEPTRRAVTAERSLLGALGGGCQVPIGAYAREKQGGALLLTGLVIDPEGRHPIRHEATGTDPELLGAEVAHALLKQGARSVLREVYGPSLPLAGLRVVVTRAAEQAGTLSEKLSTLGATVIDLPAIELKPPEDSGPLDRAIAAIADYDWLLFTSANGVRFFFERARQTGASLTGLRARVAAVGPITAAAAREHGLKVHLVPPSYLAESLAEAFAEEPLEGKRVLLPRARVARDVIPNELIHRGADLDIVEAYRNAVPANLESRARRVLALRPDWITFTSGSTIKNIIAAAGRDYLHEVKIASIGPVTSEAATRHGLHVTFEAHPSTIEALVEGLLAAERGG